VGSVDSATGAAGRDLSRFATRSHAPISWPTCIRACCASHPGGPGLRAAPSPREFRLVAAASSPGKGMAMDRAFCCPRDPAPARTPLRTTSQHNLPLTGQLHRRTFPAHTRTTYPALRGEHATLPLPLSSTPYTHHAHMQLLYPAHTA
jgi:hypothetical protein